MRHLNPPAGSRPWLLAALLLALGVQGCASARAAEGGRARGIDAPASFADGVFIAELGKDMSAHLRVFHPSGVELGVRRLSFGEDQIVLGLTARNHSDRTIELAGSSRMILRDDSGYEYRMVQLRGDMKLKLVSGEDIDAEFTFLGGLRRDARSLTLVVNDGAGSRDQETTPQPYIVIGDLPVHEWRAPEVSRLNTWD